MPITPVEPVDEMMHGVCITDPYRWLEDQSSERTREWLLQQVTLSNRYLNGLPNRPRIRGRVSEYLSFPTLSIPIKVNNRYFFSRRDPGQDQASIYFRSGSDGADCLLVDPNRDSDGSTSFVILTVSENARRVAYGVREGGEDEFAVRFVDVDSRQILSDGIPKEDNLFFCPVPDLTGYYYRRALNGESAVCFHNLNTDRAADTELLRIPHDPKCGIGLMYLHDLKYLLVLVTQYGLQNTTDCYIYDLGAESHARQMLKGFSYKFIPLFADRDLYFLTDYEAPNNRLMRLAWNESAPGQWKEVVGETDSTIRYVSNVGGRVFVSYVTELMTRTHIFQLNGKFIGEIDYPEAGTATVPSGYCKSDEAFYMFSSLRHPPTIFRYNTRSGKQDIWWQCPIPVDLRSIRIKRTSYTSKDGTNIPISIAYKRTTRRRKGPTILTAYGGFGLSQTSSFSSRAALWIELGGFYAVANIRGGGEFGEAWHNAAVRQKRQTAFDDFLKGAEWLIERGYTSRSKLALVGGSNAGLLVGAALTQCPNICAAVVCSCPLLDMLRYHLRPSMHLYISEFGCSDDRAEFEYLLKYSPYHRVVDGVAYPAALFLSGDADTRCDPMHARKMVAKLQAATSSSRPILLHYSPKRGHAGTLPLHQRIETLTDQLCFLSTQLDMWGHAARQLDSGVVEGLLNYPVIRKP